MTRAIGMAVVWATVLLHDHGKIKVKKASRAGTLFGIYLLSCLLSCVYSVSRFQSFVKVVEMLTDLVLIYMLFNSMPRDRFVKETFDLSIYICFILLTISLIGFFIFPGFFANTGYYASLSSLGIRLGAGLLGANKASALAALGIIWLLLLIYKRKFLTYVMLVVCVLVMFFSQSRSSLALIPIIIFAKIFRSKDKFRFLYILGVLIIVAIAISNYEIIYNYLLRGQSVDELMSATGRTTMWEYAREYIAQRPLIGYGFGAGGELVALRYGVATVHSGIYETLLGTGMIGFIVLIPQYIYACRIVLFNWVNKGFQKNIADIIILIYFLIRSVTSLGIANWHSPELMIWLLFIFSIKKGDSLQMIYMRST